MLIGIVSWVVVGLIIGFIASKLVDLKGDDPKLGIALGAAGAIAGGWLYSAISGNAVYVSNMRALIFAAIGAVTALLAWHLIRHNAAPIPYLNKRYH
ncbi:MAG TPA: hypothetical protein VKK61_04020 [Tepidisphaeraceae bacterium]|nr:hypothetical protein [Tepidisphaeraceae bacterium]